MCHIKGLRVVRHTAHTWLLRKPISKATNAKDLKLHMTKTHYNTITHTKYEGERTILTQDMKLHHSQSIKKLFLTKYLSSVADFWSAISYYYPLQIYVSFC